jgi:hypothetical protein
MRAASSSRGISMAFSYHHPWFLALVFAGCRAPVPARAPSSPSWAPPTEAAIGEAALAAVAAAPWDSEPSGWGILCTSQAPCDTLVVEPRIVALPSQPPAFFVPDRRQVAATLGSYALSLSHVPGRHTIIGPWRECSARRDAPRRPEARVACVALGIAGYETARPDPMTFALLVVTPAKGLSWPRVRVTRAIAGAAGS